MKKNLFGATAMGTWERRLGSGKWKSRDILDNLPKIVMSRDFESEDFKERLSNRLSNPDLVRCSGQSPFSYLEAYLKVESIRNRDTVPLLNALEDAVRVSVENMGGFARRPRVLVATNVSESMLSPVAPGSPVRRLDIGAFLSLLLSVSDIRVVAGVFGSVWEIVHLYGAVLANTSEAYSFASSFRRVVGEGANGASVIDYLVGSDIRMDKVLLFADRRMWDGDDPEPGRAGASVSASWSAYKAMYPEAELYLFDLSGDGEGRIERRGMDVRLVSGWNGDVLMDND